MLAQRLLVLALLALVPAACSNGDDAVDGGSGGKGAGSGATSGQASGAAGASGAGAGGSAGSGAGSSSGGMASGGAPAGGASSDAAIVPESLQVMALDGGNGVLTLTGLTLQDGAAGLVLFAALKNEGDTPACEAGFSVELYDKAEQSVGAGIAGLLTQHLYRFTDGSGTVVACVGPGDVTMTAVTDLPSDILASEIGFAVYRCPYFALEVESIDGLSVSGLAAVADGVATKYTGQVTNGLDIAVNDPTVSVFPVNGAGRPLGLATAMGTSELGAGDSWSFETNALDALGVDQVAYATASP